MKENKRSSIKSAKLFAEVCVLVTLAITAVYIGAKEVRQTEDISRAPIVDSGADIDIEEPTEVVDENKIIFEGSEIPTKDKFKGDLILVNNDTQYFTGDEELVSLNTQLKQDGVTSFTANDNSLKVRKEICTPLENLLNEFKAQKQIDDVVIISGFRTQEKQQQLYDADLAKTGLDYSELVAKPGYSEHQTGFAVDFTTSTTWDYDGLGDYEWIDENCWKYGFVLRYPENKTDITQIRYEPWHYRYVGVPHAYYMYKNGLCMEEYIEKLRSYTYEGGHLEFTDDLGVKYEIYFVKSDDGAETTFVPVPVNAAYDISGNNVDGFIVTLYADQITAIPGMENTTSAESQAE
jgi:D-alanyl-D-alanine carboxypeptidase